MAEQNNEIVQVKESEEILQKYARYPPVLVNAETAGKDTYAAAVASLRLDVARDIARAIHGGEYHIEYQMEETECVIEWDTRRGFFSTYRVPHLIGPLKGTPTAAVVDELEKLGYVVGFTAKMVDPTAGVLPDAPPRTYCTMRVSW
jgi:hypothetical protein